MRVSYRHVRGSATVCGHVRGSARVAYHFFERYSVWNVFSSLYFKQEAVREVKLDWWSGKPNTSSRRSDHLVSSNLDREPEKDNAAEPPPALAVKKVLISLPPLSTSL